MIQRRHVANSLGLHDLVFTGQHAIHHLAHFAGQDWQVFPVLFTIDDIQLIADRFVHTAQPGSKLIKDRLHLDAWRVAGGDVDLAVVSESFMHLTHAVVHLAGFVELASPLGPVFRRDFVPLEHGVQVVLELLRRVWHISQLREHVQVEVSRLMQECRVV